MADNGSSDAHAVAHRHSSKDRHHCTMKLHIVPARTGIAWVRLGIKTFFRQPLALSGLFFMFLAVMSLASMVPVVGLALAMALLPACTLGLMAASKEAADGRFPMPAVFLQRVSRRAPRSCARC